MTAVTENDFRELALSLPESVEAAHMSHPDFRVAGKIFATLGYPDAGWAMVKLTSDQQDAFVKSFPAMFVPVKGGWGARGATHVVLSEADREIAREALVEAWRNTAPKRLQALHPDP